jgi:hypothetical protein
MIAPNPYRPADRSAIEVPIFAGSPSGSPVTANSPAAACTTVSYAGLDRHGPVCPKPDIDAYTSRGLRAESASQPRPRRSITPGRKFSISTSARSASRSTTARSSDDLRSSAIDSLPRLIRAK